MKTSKIAPTVGFFLSNGVHIILGVIISILLLIIFYNMYKIFIEKRNENMTTQQTKEYKCHNWWPANFTEGCDKGIVDGLIKPLTADIKQTKIDVYSVFEYHKKPPTTKEENKANNTLSIQLSGESFCDDTDKYDVNLVMEKEDLEKRIITVPWGYSDLCSKNTPEKTKEILDSLTKKRTISNNSNELIKIKPKFCIFVVSNPANPVRNRFFEKLSEYKKVDSYGKYANNMGDEEYTFDKIAEYKFMICFENKPKEDYLTEKLMNAYLGGAIPIYWGCTNVHHYVNPDAIQLLDKEENMDKLIEQIKELDNDEEKYKAAYETIFFKDGKLPDEFNGEILKTKIQKIINEDQS